MKQKQGKCSNCGPVLATTSDPLSTAEILGLAGLSLFTCGAGLLVAIPYAAWRGFQSSKYRCSKCGRGV